MLMQIGAVRFEIAPLNAHKSTHTTAARFATKPVLGARPPLEWIGEGDEAWDISARLFPQKFGGLSSLSALAAMQRSGRPQYLVRGDGALMGWVVILDVAEASSHLDAQGVGKVIDVTIKVQRSDKPEPGGYFSALASAFIGAIS